MSRRSAMRAGRARPGERRAHDLARSDDSVRARAAPGVVTRVFLVAGEASGDALGAGLMAGLRAQASEIAFFGVGGPRMRAEGLDSLFPMDELSVMGIAEVVPRYPRLRHRLRQTVEAILTAAPDVLVTIDSPDFGLRVARRARAAAPVRTVHYVAPSVWAWRPGRARAMARYIDQVLALLPFEPAYMEAAGMRCDFVGHPAATAPQPHEAERAAFRAAHGLAPSTPLVLVLPGSRRTELARLAPVFGAALSRLAERVPAVRVVAVAAPGLEAALARAVEGWPGAPIRLAPDSGEKAAAFAAADAALAASGTVSLELAAAGTPMVVAYDMAWLSWQIVARLARTDTATLVNLVSGTRAVPEFLGPACRPAPIAGALESLLSDPQARAAQHAAMAETIARLGAGGPTPGLRAAEAVLDGLAAGPVHQ